ncbi:BMP family ABC transporter substrate-binding protein [Bacillus sp. HNG]|uniref:ABC transporter substrate-binding protein n=1 Tax=Bacillus sp. HNG TaxID=2293325 RepID=UPI000E2F6018|nr:ABC transporter substrate-binding protein [Bacillus sp. HNG]RFB17441.1 BMP family ABC transporter substrate-binding protein [Bacillus sp. HNG]
MKRKLLVFLIFIVMSSLLLAACGSNDSAGDEKEGNSKHKVILITMDSTDQHWVSVDKGAKKAADELGDIEYKWMAPDKKDDAQQIERVNNAIADGADAIIIAANGPDAITASLEEAKNEGIKIVYVDSPANTDAFATFTTDNLAAGRLAGEELLKALEEKGITEGKVGIVNFNSSTDTAIKREQGFRDAFKDTNYTLLETQYGEGDAAKSQDIAENYITEGVVGIYGTNEGSTVGVGNAIKGSGQGVIGIGFDKSDAILSLVKDGSLLAVMGQNPETMGYEGMNAALKAIKGEEIEEKDVDTGVSVITKDTIK